MATSNVLSFPADEKAFEENCIPLFVGLLGDPNVKLVGTRGMKQRGVDLIGRRDRDSRQPVGIQCKLITRGSKLTEATIRAEVSKALTVSPRLTEYYIVTTANDDPEHDSVAIELSQEQERAGRTIDIQVWGWGTMQEKIRRDPDALRAFDPNYSASTNRLTTLGAEIVEQQAFLVDQAAQTNSLIENFQSLVVATFADTQRSAALDAHLDTQVDDYRDLMNCGKPRTALTLLEKLEGSLTPANSSAIRARVRANLGFAHLKLGADERAGHLISDAYAINPDDPKVRGNYVLALALLGRPAEAMTIGREILAEDPTNAGAAAMVFHVASLAEVDEDPYPIVPPDLLGDKAVLLNHISYMRQKGTPQMWRELAAAAVEAYPDDIGAKRFAAEALIDEGLQDGAVLRATALSTDQLGDLQLGGRYLQEIWDEVRVYENASDEAWTVVGCNLITTYRVLGDLDSAKRIGDQLFALSPEDPDVLLSRALIDMDLDDVTAVIHHLQDLPESRERTMMLLAAWSKAGDWTNILAFATEERRGLLGEHDAQSFDVMVFRARNAAEAGFDLDLEAETLLTRWPTSPVAHVIVADCYRHTSPEKSATARATAHILLTDESGFADRVMFAQLALFEEAWDEIISALDGYVSLTKHSEPLGWLAVAFANAPLRPRTKAFFASLSAQLISTARYARLAGAAEHNRGDLVAAERHLRTALHDDPSDLRASLLLISTLERDNRALDVTAFIDSICEDDLRGSSIDLIRLALILRRHGRTDRALALGYRTAAANRQDEDIMSSYPALIFYDESLPEAVGRRGPIAEHYWFSLAGEEGAKDVDGVIDREQVAGVNTFNPEHSLASLLQGKAVGETVELAAEFGPDRRYGIKEIKHKYIWLLHDIMATHASRFPEGRSLVEVTMREGDVQPVLDMVKDLESRGHVILETYKEFPIPVAAIASMANRSVVAFVEHLANIGENLRTCLGSNEERASATLTVRESKGNGAVFDTLTFWFAHQAKVLPALKAYFGRLLIPRSTLDDLVEMRGQAELHRGREYMTMGFEGDQPWRRVHTSEETEAQIAAIAEAIDAAQNHCEVMPVDGSEDHRLDQAIGPVAAAKIADPFHVAKAENVLLLSDDLNLRQFAASFGATRSAWLQIALTEALDSGLLDEPCFLRSIGLLAAYRHDHVSLSAAMLVSLAQLEDDSRLAHFMAASEFIGGPNAEIGSHFSVVLEFALLIWNAKLPTWQQASAVGILLSKLLRFRPDWKETINLLDRGFVSAERRGARNATNAREYLEQWVEGHFLNLGEIRSLNPLIDSQIPSAGTAIDAVGNRNFGVERPSSLRASKA